MKFWRLPRKWRRIWIVQVSASSSFKHLFAIDGDTLLEVTDDEVSRVLEKRRGRWHWRFA